MSDIERVLAEALPDVISDPDREVYGDGSDSLDVPNEWYMTPRQMAARIITALESADHAIVRKGELERLRRIEAAARGLDLTPGRAVTSKPDLDVLRAALEPMGDTEP